jgi:phospholipid/cholesterol/gamma-HCH transport system ATP-binding protein
MEQSLIEFKNVYKKLGNLIILDDVNLHIKKGEIFTLIGKSGVGKSVLLKHIIGLMEPDSGQILYQGKPLSKMTREEKKQLKHKFSYMFQSTALFDSMTVFQNIALPLKEKNHLSDKEVNKYVLERMKQLEIDGLGQKYPSQLSGGMKKRVALARALITDPEIVLFDEPTTGLDPIRKNAVHSMIADYQQRLGFTAILISHEIPDIFYISQRIAMLDEGKIIFEGSPDEIQQTQNRVIQQFVQGLESRHDTLTEIRPQPQGENRFREELARLDRYQVSFSLLIFTLGNLEEIHEKAGHAAGQTALRNFVRELKQHLRQTDPIYRYGLNKIVAVLTSTNEEQARQTCDKLIKNMNIKDILGPYPGKDLCCTVNVGFAEVQKDTPYEEVIGLAESNQNLMGKMCFTHNEQQSPAG